MTYILRLWVEHRNSTGRVVSRSHQRTLEVDGIDTTPLAKYQARHETGVGFSYTLKTVIA